MEPLIYIDTRQQRGKHEIKHSWLAAHGVSTELRTLDFGDYMTPGSNVSVDTKRDIDEVAKNINGKNHDRFKRECIRARDAGYRLVILVENHDNVICLDDLKKWTNGHCLACNYYKRKTCDPTSGGKCLKHGTRKPIQGERLARAMSTMSDRYGVRFEFCPPVEAARRICNLLGVDYQPLCEDCYRYRNGECLAAYGFRLVDGPAKQVFGGEVMCDWGCPF